MPVENCIQSSPQQTQLNFQLFLPHDYLVHDDSNYPLFLFLHGAKKRGEDIHKLDGYGMNRIAENNQEFPYIVLTPQCPADSDWITEFDTVMALVDETVTKYRVDSKRIYVTGFSMGGNGAWHYASKMPGLFAAAVPLSGWYDPDRARTLMDMPVWAFHCVDDDVVSCSGTEEMVEALTIAGGKVKATYYTGLKHDHQVMYETYNNPDLHAWLAKQTRNHL
ncbi:alpha/beta hydrolase-fold protein [Paenibacillus pasadenensis]|uniref:carboxylesterase family protein n=1 Tax=Paenibacillus pasadenensis TaxID=217090 RepID=UPI0020414593|nr:PHB depolymerase family esterase [Paenibacillus pasadenensis]MCM3748619.1 alpha/beta hydrolase-fold protein [Paenibacillus pasadenensis]